VHIILIKGTFSGCLECPLFTRYNDEDGGFMGTEDTIGGAFLNDISAEDN
jgi:hypothetical protein